MNREQHVQRIWNALLVTAIVVTTMVALSGCANTWRGLGQDMVQWAGPPQSVD